MARTFWFMLVGFVGASLMNPITIKHVVIGSILVGVAILVTVIEYSLGHVER